MNQNYSALISGVFICLGALGAGYMIANAFQKEGTVLAKGISERIVKADQATIHLHFSLETSTPEELESQSTALKSELEKHFSTLGYQNIHAGKPNFNRIKKYDDSGALIDEKFQYNGVLKVTSDDVEKVAGFTIDELHYLKKGIDVSYSQTYTLTSFNNLRPEMLKEAIVNAREVGQKFASDSGKQLGEIRVANQGVFSIVGEHHKSDSSDWGEQHSVNKKVRVVSTIKFTLK